MKKQISNQHSNLHRFWSQLGSILGGFWKPRWGQVGTKPIPKSIFKSIIKTIIFRIALGADFDRFWIPKWPPRDPRRPKLEKLEVLHKLAQKRPQSHSGQKLSPEPHVSWCWCLFVLSVWWFRDLVCLNSPGLRPNRRVRSSAPVPVPGSWSSGPLDSSSGVQKDTRMVSLGDAREAGIGRPRSRNPLFQRSENQSGNRWRFLWILGAKTDPTST